MGNKLRERKISTGIERITKEMVRQLGSLGWSHLHDESHTKMQLAMAAKAYINYNWYVMIGNSHETAVAASLNFWPWKKEEFKPSLNMIRNLEKAGAMLAAEIDRLERSGVPLP